MTCIVADLGGTFLRCALASDDGGLLSLERTRLPGDAYSRKDDVWSDIIEAIAAYADRHAARIPPFAPISFAFPGPVVDGKAATAAPTVLAGDGRPPDIRQLLANRTGREVFLINDVSAAAWYFSEHLAARRFAVVTVSSGIGAKIFDHRHSLGVLDDVPSAGEIGHLVVRKGYDAPLCDCGGRGHLGAISSARGIERRARQAARAHALSFQRSACVTRFGATAATLSNEVHIVPAIRAGDAWAIAHLRSSIEPLAEVLRALAVGCGLEGIVIMGGFAQQLGEIYRSLIETAICTPGRGPARVDLHGIIVAAVDVEASLSGAGAYTRLRRLVS